MIKTPLLPNWYKWIGWCLLVPGLILGMIVTATDYEANWLSARVLNIIRQDAIGPACYFTFVKTNLTATLAGLLILVGGMLVAFSREKQEDEFIARLRLSSLMWAVVVNYVLLLLALLFVYGMSFFHVMVYNMFTVLLIFIARFNYLLYKNNKTAPDEK
ncbi:MAG: LPXTG cell wall anchor domain-containing protein [Agriterribacter sp.]